MGVCADVLDAGLGSSRAASHASSTLERGLEGQETDLDRLALMEVIEGPSALEAATAENLVLKDGADTYPAPEDVAGDDSARAGNPSHCPAPEGTAGGDPAQVGSANYGPAPEGVRAGSPSCTSMDVDGTELVPAGSLRANSGDGPMPSHQLISHDLGVPSFFSNLQVL
jgi:hypothetical protein